MTIPTSIDIQFRRLDKSLKELEGNPPGKLTMEETAIIVSEIANTCSLTLDKAMNAVWGKHNEKKLEAKKANIYFPSSDNDEIFKQKLSQYQMPNLETNNPEIYKTILSTQTHNNGKWLATLKKVAGLRHEAFPIIANKTRQQTFIGAGQNIYIEKLITGPQGEIIELKGTGFDRITGLPQPLRIETKREIVSLLEEANMTPYDFSSLIVSKTKQTVKQIYMNLPK